MDPIAVVKALWRFKLLVVPVVLLTLGAAVFVYQFGPRSYESGVSYAIVHPDAPTSTELENDPELAQLNNDNPYIRSADPTLVTNVLITRLSANPVADALAEAGLGAEYTVARGVGGNGFVIDVTGGGNSAELSLATTNALGVMLEDELYTIQTINGADARYLFTALVVSPPDRAIEQFSSRLRAVIVVLLGGAVLLFGAVSLGRGLEVSRQERRAGGKSGSEPPAEAEEEVSGADLIVPNEHRTAQKS